MGISDSRLESYLLSLAAAAAVKCDLDAKGCVFEYMCLLKYKVVAMGKDRLIENPFPELQVSAHDQQRLKDLANTLIMTNLDKCNAFVSSDKGKVDPRRWKPITEREQLRVYAERRDSAQAAAGSNLTGSGLPMILCVGSVEGKLNDLMYGVMSEDLETMRIKASWRLHQRSLLPQHFIENPCSASTHTNIKSSSSGGSPILSNPRSSAKNQVPTMKVSGPLLLAATVSSSLALTTEPPASLGAEQQQTWEAFVDYALDFQKDYRDAANDAALVQRRFRAFATNVERIRAHNEAAERGEFSFTLGLNDLADLADAEYRQLLSYRASSAKAAAVETFTRPESLDDLPDSWDWRKHDAVTPVKNQGQCGSCWAFSAVAAMECAYALSTGTLESFSEQELVDCTLGGVDDCNHGGEMSEGYEEIIQHHGGKIDREADYEYTAESKGVCNAKDDKAVGHFTAYANVTSGDELALQAAIATKGVQAVAIDASSFTFQLYRHGVYSWPLCGNAPDALDHGVAAAGYGVYKKKDFWLVKNSWGDSWGMKGYIMMSRNKDNQCGIATDASYPIMTKEELSVKTEARAVVQETTEVASVM
ncbi:unnamed protein product [Phytophthora lilii]|uniref:Unnamed protein product n=1 Tax=Phytophthora lilii TaxID=2077276 RepID=A0A9W6WZE7_9STRA|nr:unnamed protein product [Phytophthora lilii]